jgi:diacylglycerol kinase (ATP)
MTPTIHETRPDESIPTIVRNWLSEGDRQLVVAAGGDGTVREVIDGLVGSPTPLLIVPLGTANVLARALGIPRGPGDALDAVLPPGRATPGSDGSETPGCGITSVPLDVMRHDSRHFVLTISVGMTARSVAGTSRADKRRLGSLAYLWRVVKSVPGATAREFDVAVDGEHRRVRATDVVVTNGIFLEDFPAVLGSRESYRDGRVEVHAIHGRSFWEYLRFAARRLAGVRREADRFDVLSATREVRITSLAGTLHVQGDGEVLAPPPVAITVVPRAVRVAVPRE